MRRNVGAWLALAVAFGACAGAPQPLNSESIAARFGNFGIEILAHEAVPGSAAVRRANLYSTHDGTRICRTYAVTRFNQRVPGLIAEEHARVLAGGSIGATFKAGGWQVSKATRYLGEIDAASAGPAVTSLMRLAGEPVLAMHVYRMWLIKDSQAIEYATIIEVHHPDYLDLAALAERYPAGMAPDPAPQQVELWRALIAGSAKGPSASGL